MPSKINRYVLSAISLMTIITELIIGEHPIQIQSLETCVDITQELGLGLAKKPKVVQEVSATDELNMEEPNDKYIGSLLKDGEKGFDIEKKKVAVKNFVEMAADFLLKNELSVACDSFLHSNQFKNGDLRIFCLDNKGNYYAHGADKTVVWENLINLVDIFQTPIVKNIIKTSEAGSGWLTYIWRGETKVTYVKQVLKDGVTYIVGSGYFAHSKADETVSMVKGAVSLFNKLVIEEQYPTEEAFSSFSYPMGRFVSGDLYIYALDFQGNIMANGDRPGVIGSNALNYKDEHGKLINQEIIKKLQENPGKGVWVDAFSKGANELIYAERVQDARNKEYFIACRYYPTVTREKVIELVKDASVYMKKNGRGIAADTFNSRSDALFKYGQLWISVIDDKGNVIANGFNPDVVGTNIINDQDEDGFKYIQALIKRGQEGGGWVNFRIRGAFISGYVEELKLSVEKYYIISGLFPVSKNDTTALMLSTAVSYLRTNEVIESFRTFVDKKGPFIRGDLSVTVYDSNGICLVAGEDYEKLWKNMLDDKDQDGKPYVRLLINGVKRGPVKLSYRLDNAVRVDYAQQIEKDGNTYIVVCGYFM